MSAPSSPMRFRTRYMGSVRTKLYTSSLSRSGCRSRRIDTPKSMSRHPPPGLHDQVGPARGIGEGGIVVVDAALVQPPENATKLCPRAVHRIIADILGCHLCEERPGKALLSQVSRQGRVLHRTGACLAGDGGDLGLAVALKGFTTNPPSSNSSMATRPRARPPMVMAGRAHSV